MQEKKRGECRVKKMLEIVRKNDDILKYVVMVVTAVALLVLSESGALASSGGSGSEFYGGDTESFVTKSVLTIKIVRFIAIFIVIAGIVWAGAEFAIKHDQQRGANILISAVIGGFAVLLAPTLINFVIGGLGISGITQISQ